MDEMGNLKHTHTDEFAEWWGVGLRIFLILSCLFVSIFIGIPQLWQNRMLLISGRGLFFSVSHWNRKEDETKNKNKTWIPFLFFTTSPTLLFCLVPPPPLWLCMELMMMQHFIHDKNGGKEEEKVKLCVKCANRSSLVSIFYWLIKYYYLCLSVGHRSDMLSSVDSIREKKIY